MNGPCSRFFWGVSFLLLAALPASAREVLTPEEQAERERERKRQAPPVLVCEPTELRAEMESGETKALRLSIRNAGGRTLGWSVKSAPGWVRMDVLSGEVGFGESRTVGLAVHSEILQPGTSRGEIVIEAPGAEGSPATVSVTVNVRPKKRSFVEPAPAVREARREWSASVSMSVYFAVEKKNSARWRFHVEARKRNHSVIGSTWQGPPDGSFEETYRVCYRYYPGATPEKRLHWFLEGGVASFGEYQKLPGVVGGGVRIRWTTAKVSVFSDLWGSVLLPDDETPWPQLNFIPLGVSLTF